MSPIHDVLVPTWKRFLGNSLIGLLSFLIACQTVGTVVAQPADAKQLMQKALQAKADNYQKLKRLSGVTEISEAHPPIEFINRKEDTDKEVIGARYRQDFLLDGDNIRVNLYHSPGEVFEAYAHHKGVWRAYYTAQKRMVITEGTGVKYRDPFDPRNFGLENSDDTLESALADGELSATVIEKDGQLESFTLTVYIPYDEEAVAYAYTFTRENRFLLSQRTYTYYANEAPTPLRGKVVLTRVVTYQQAPDADALFPEKCVSTEFRVDPTPRWIGKTTWEIKNLRTAEGNDTTPFSQIEVPEGTEIDSDDGQPGRRLNL